MDTDDLIFVVCVCYVSVQAALLLSLSIYGYYFVKRQMTPAVPLKQSLDQNQLQFVSVVAGNKDEVKSDQDMDKNPVKKKKVFVSWIKLVWKLRSVYSSFIIHTFDITTDVIVIIAWWFEESGKNNEGTQNVDTQLMAQTSIAIIIFHKIMSSIAVWISEKSIIRALLQFFDLLIFFEIYNAHKKVVSQYANARNGSDRSNKDNKYGMC